ncbi:MAG: head decoration protein [Desulfobacterium sp.]|nr:head decoration protein [Desulfobacterium sp.]
MTQSLGTASRVFSSSEFLGDHPPITVGGILGTGNHVSGTVLGTVTATNKHVQLAPGADDGSQVASVILLGDLDASVAGEPGVFVVHGEVLGQFLTWPDGITDAQKTTAKEELKVAGIYVK